MAHVVKNPPAGAGDASSAPEAGNPLEEEMTTHSSILVCEIPWPQEPGGYSLWGSRESDTYMSDWAHTCTHIREVHPLYGVYQIQKLITCGTPRIMDWCLTISLGTLWPSHVDLSMNHINDWSQQWARLQTSSPGSWDSSLLAPFSPGNSAAASTWGNVFGGRVPDNDEGTQADCLSPLWGLDTVVCGMHDVGCSFLQRWRTVIILPIFLGTITFTSSLFFLGRNEKITYLRS